jgi:hypothetical protein
MGTDDSFQELIEILRLEGVEDTDAIWWHSLSPIQQEGMYKNDLAHRLLATKALVEKKGLSIEQAMLEIRKAFPTYVSYPLSEEVKNSLKNEHRDDYPLPYELHDRIDRFIINMSNERRIEFIKQKNKFLWMNGLIRYLIRNGEL